MVNKGIADLPITLCRAKVFPVGGKVACAFVLRAVHKGLY